MSRVMDATDEALPSALVNALSGSDNVVAILIEIEADDGELHVWTCVKGLGDPVVERDVFEREAKIIGSFPDIAFDFNLIDLKEVEHLVNEGARVIYLRRE